MNETNKRIWIAFVVIVVIAALGFWWISWNQPVSSSTPGTIASSTVSTSTSAGSTSFAAPIDRTSDSVVAVAESLVGASSFQSLFESTGVAAKITGKGPYTIFVPTNGAISELPAGTISDMTATQLKRLVEYHVVVGRAIDAQAESAGSIQAMSGDVLNFSYNATKIPMVNSSILITEYKASNGTVYLINNVLIPPTKTTQ